MHAFHSLSRGPVALSNATGDGRGSINECHRTCVPQYSVAVIPIVAVPPARPGAAPRSGPRIKTMQHRSKSARRQGIQCDLRLGAPTARTGYRDHPLQLDRSRTVRLRPAAIDPNISPPVPLASPLVGKDRKGPPYFRESGRLDCSEFPRSTSVVSLSRAGHTGDFSASLASFLDMELDVLPYLQYGFPYENDPQHR